MAGTFTWLPSYRRGLTPISAAPFAKREESSTKSPHPLQGSSFGRTRIGGIVPLIPQATGHGPLYDRFCSR